MNCPFRYYWICHAVAALLIAAAVSPLLGIKAGLASGVAFYAGREFTQWQSGKPFDWPGILAPLIACGAVLAVVVAL